MAIDQGTYQIGIEQIDITPPTGAYLGGFAGRTEPSTGAYHPLRATAFAIDDGVTPVLILTAEWLGFYDRTDRVRQQISNVTGLPASQIVLSASHTHCGPAMWRYESMRDEPINQKYTDQTIDKMIDCVLSAWQSRQPATIRVGNGQCDLAMCRRFPDPDNLPQVLRPMTPYRDGHTDHEVPIVTIYHPDGELRSVLYSYACHPTSRGGLQFGGDYVAFATDRIEQEYPGVTAAFLQGCGGDQKVRPADPLADSFGQRTVDQVREAGYELGDAVNNTLKQNDFQKVHGSISVTQAMLELQTESLNDDLIQSNLTGQHEYQRQWAQHQLDQIELGDPVSTAVDFELQTICFGRDLVIITMAAEMSVEYSLRLKRELRSHFGYVLPLGYTNSIVGYIPVKRQIPEWGYEVWDANQYEHLTGPYVAQTEEQIVNALHRALE